MKDTQKQKIIKYIRQKGSITSWEAYQELEITQFATRVKELKDEGYNFESRWEKKKNKEEKLTRFKRYYFSK